MSDEEPWDAVENARPVRRNFDEDTALGPDMPGHVIEHDYGRGGPAVPAPDGDDLRCTLAAIGSLAGWSANTERIAWTEAQCLRDLLESADELVALAASCQRALRERLAALDAVRLADGAEGQS